MRSSRSGGGKRDGVFASVPRALNKALTNSGNTLLLLGFRACRAANAGTLLTPLLTYSERSPPLFEPIRSEPMARSAPRAIVLCGCVSKS
jgi:hypothetical protein